MSNPKLLAAFAAVDQIIATDGVWASHPDHPRDCWRHEVINEDTNLGYWDWVRHQIEAAAHDESQAQGAEAASVSSDIESALQLLGIADKCVLQIVSTRLADTSQLRAILPTESPVALLLLAALDLCQTVEATGGVLVDDDNQLVGLGGDEEWLDLAEAAEVAESALTSLGITAAHSQFALSRHLKDEAWDEN